MKQIFNWWLTALFLMTFLSGNALASKLLIGPEAYVLDPEPVKIGQTQLLPVRIDYLPDGVKSATIKFDGGDNPIKIEEVKLDLDKATSFPYLVYVPVTVTDEGMFYVKGMLHVELLDGVKILGYNGTSFDRTLHFGIFAFDGEVFFGGDDELATKNKASRNLQKKNSEFSKLYEKRQKINDGSLKGQTLSNEEKEKLRGLNSEETNKLRKQYFERYPIKTEPTSKLLKSTSRHNSDFVLFTICDMKSIKSAYIFDYFFKGGKTKTYIGV